MEDFKVQSCRLCLSDISDENYELANITKEILSIPLSKLDFEEDRKYVMCNICSSKLQAAIKCKSTCLYTTNDIVSYVDDATMQPMDLKNIYTKEREYIDTPDHIKISHLYQNRKNMFEFKSIKEEQVDMMQEFVPEVNSSNEHFNFLMNCSDEQKSIEYISRVQDAPSLDGSVKLEDVDVDVKHSIEPGFLDIKDEHIKTESDLQYQEICSESEACLKSNYKASEKTNKTLITMLKHKAWYSNRIVDHKIQEYPLNVQLYKCQQCDFKSKFKTSLATHILIHQDPSEVPMYKCENCDYATKHKGNLNMHMLIHKEPSQVQMYKCEYCDYATKHKRILKPHMLKHKSRSEIQMHKCVMCSYEAKHKSYLKIHMLKHKHPSEVEIHKCETCNYETLQKKHLQNDILIHKRPSEVQMYNCEHCSYVTIRKGDLKLHMVIHKNPSEVQMYKCATCNYETVYRNNLESHILIHKPPSEVQMYNCEKCNYATKRKGDLKLHILIHKRPAEVPMYKCVNCNYETKRKGHLKRHILTHKSNSIS